MKNCKKHVNWICKFVFFWNRYVEQNSCRVRRQSLKRKLKMRRQLTNKIEKNETKERKMMKQKKGEENEKWFGGISRPAERFQLLFAPPFKIKKERLSQNSKIHRNTLDDVTFLYLSLFKKNKSPLSISIFVFLSKYSFQFSVLFVYHFHTVFILFYVDLK